MNHVETLAGAESSYPSKERNEHAAFDVAVIYNGVEKKVEVRPDETVKSVLDRVINIFGPLPQPHTLALYNSAGAELNEVGTVSQAGIHPHDRLLLRPSQVKGG